MRIFKFEIGLKSGKVIKSFIRDISLKSALELFREDCKIEGKYSYY